MNNIISTKVATHYANQKYKLYVVYEAHEPMTLYDFKSEAEAEAKKLYSKMNSRMPIRIIIIELQGTSE